MHADGMPTDKGKPPDNTPTAHRDDTNNNNNDDSDGNSDSNQPSDEPSHNQAVILAVQYAIKHTHPAGVMIMATMNGSEGESNRGRGNRDNSYNSD